MIAGLLLMAVLLGFFRKADLFESFAQGAEEGFKSAIRVIPYLAATFTALRVLESSGLLEALTQSIRPLSALLGLPSGTEPLLLLRPLSGSASLGLLKSIPSQYGPDSRTGLVASAMMGSGETVLYSARFICLPPDQAQPICHPGLAGGLGGGMCRGRIVFSISQA